MIIREIQSYRVLDATSNLLETRPLDHRLILAPLLRWRIELNERRLTLLEPQTGSLGAPDPNAFMIVVPPSFATGQVFGIELLDTDWESEGFAIGDVLEMAMGGVIANTVLLRATIQGISGRAAMFIINNVYLVAGTLDTQNPFPLVAFLVNERFDVKAAFLREGDSGFISPLNGQPFYISGHPNSLIIPTVSVTNSTLRYNIRLYDAPREAMIDSFLPNARNLKNVYVEVGGTQFYAYRTSLNPTANTPTLAYPTRGKIIIDAKAPNILRNLAFETDCLLLHPNRIEETNNFVTPGTLIMTGGGSSISAPSIPSPVKSLVCLLGPDSHHSLPSVFNSGELTNEVAPPDIPPSRLGADYVGVVVGQVSGRWVAAMTNRIPSTPPSYDLRLEVGKDEPARYDCILLKTDSLSARLTGTYIVMIYGKIRGSFVLIASYELNIRVPDTAPTPDFLNGTEALGNLFAFDEGLPPIFSIGVANYDIVFTEGHPDLGTSTLFFVPIPSGIDPPPIESPDFPRSGFLLDLWPFLDPEKEIKVQLLCPDGNLLDSNPKRIKEPKNDNIYANITTSGGVIRITLNDTQPTNLIHDLRIRVAIFPWPAGHTPIQQAMYRAEEDYSLNRVIKEDRRQSSRITINRDPLTRYSYDIQVETDGLPPGTYAIHVRSEFSPRTWGEGYESFFYVFSVNPTIDQPGEPLPPIRCRTETPAIYGEPWPYIILGQDRIENREETINGCKLEGYCSCFTLVSSIPEDWIDIIGFFGGSIMGLEIRADGYPYGVPHKVRLRGRIIRIDDEYSTESFVSTSYRQEDIVRSYAPRYQLEVITQSPCDLSHIDLLKLAIHWTVINRSNRMLPREIRFLRPAELSLSDSGEHTKVNITLKPLRWRDEYRRQGLTER